MNRRLFFTTGLSSLAVAVGCDTEQKPSHGASLVNNGGVQDALKAMDAAIDNIEGDVGRFEDENWRTVVPDVEGAASDVRDAFDRLRRALGVADS